MNSLSDITFAIPTYNRNDYLVKILDSIPDTANVVISDNGGYVTQEIEDKYPNFLFVSPPEKLEMFQNWNFCISHIKTKWFTIQSDDDLYYPDKIHVISESIKQQSDCGLIIFGHDVIDEHGTVLSSWIPDKVNIYEPPFGYCYFKYGVDARLPSIIFNTELAKMNGLFSERYGYTAADSLLIQKCSLSSRCALIPEIVAAYRVWPENFTSKLISTTGWLDRIDQWQDEIIGIAELRMLEANVKWSGDRIKDEVYTNNLIAGLRNLSSQSFMVKYDFFKSVRFPYNASIKSKLKILKTLFKG